MKRIIPTDSLRAILTASSLIAGLLFTGAAAQAQQPAPQLPKIDEDVANIRLDGKLDEAVWQNVPYMDGMRVVIPDTLAEPAYETHTRIFYTERGIYVGVMNHQPADTIVARMTSRDTKLERDGFVLMIDPSGTGLYGYMMRINLGGSMTDATILPERQLNLQWDGSWDAETSVVDGGWAAEIFVPWSMVALPQVAGETRVMGIYTERQIGSTGETWSFPPLPDTVPQFLSAFHRVELQDIEPRTQITYYPYVSASHDGIRNEAELRAGAEVFWRPSSNMQISASLNPDFGNVESDDVVVNLTAFETFFPEKRSFFLEGQDVFNTSPRSQGARGPGGPTTLLNTRRIGGAAGYTVPTNVSVAATDLSQPTDLLGAVKLTGQNGNWRYGTLFAAEDDSEIRGLDKTTGQRVKLQAEGRDFAVARLLYEDTSRGGRRAIGWMGTDVSHDNVDAVVNGVDVHYFSADTRWIFDGQLLHSDVNGVTGAGGFGDVLYQPERGRQHRLALSYLDETLDINDLGFLSRNDNIQGDYTYSIDRSDIPGLRSVSTSYQVINQWNVSGQPTRLGLFMNRGYTFLDNSSLRTGLRYFNPRIDDRLGRGSGEFRIPERWAFSLNWRSDPGQPFSYNVGIDANQEDLGKKMFTTSAGFSYRPVDTFSLNADIDYTDREALLVYKGNGRYTAFEATQWSPKLTMDYFITAKQQLRFSMQWTGLKAFEDKFLQVNPLKLESLHEVPKPNATSDNFVISRMTFQARYRWEIAPLSDLFVVYTRGGNIPGTMFDDYPGMLVEAWEEPVVDTLVVKLRYRLGS
ncbi:MAG: hypothetical protein H7A06_02130 [Pseudomonadales bacterium]|nr:hypothetical protein [Pseudomonadales bacterium]